MADTVHQVVALPHQSKRSGSSSTDVSKIDEQEPNVVGWVKEETDSTVAIRDPDDLPDGGVQAWSVAIGVHTISYFNTKRFG